MHKKIRLIFAFLSFCFWGMSQEVDITPTPPVSYPTVDTILSVTHKLITDTIPESEKPEILYSNFVKKYTIQDISVIGVEGFYEDYILILQRRSTASTVSCSPFPQGGRATKAPRSRYAVHGLYRARRVSYNLPTARGIASRHIF